MDPGIILSGSLHTVLNGSKKVKKRTLTLSPGKLDGFREKTSKKLLLARQNSISAKIDQEFSFDLATCFNINRQDHPKFERAIAVFLPSDTLVLGWESDKEREAQNVKEFDAWYCSLTDEFQKASLSPFGLGDDEVVAMAMQAYRPFHEYCWDVEILKKGEICNVKAPQLPGHRRLCITDEGIQLIKRGTATPAHFPPDTYMFSIMVIRNYGFQGPTFTLTVGRQAPTGSGEIVIETEDPVVAKTIHGVIASIIEKRRDNRSGSFSAEAAKRVRSGTGSGSEPLRPITRDRSNTEIQPSLESIHKRLGTYGSGTMLLDHPGSIGAGVQLASLIPGFPPRQHFSGGRRSRTLSNDHEPEWSSPTLSRKTFLHNRCVSVNPTAVQLAAARKFSAGPVLAAAAASPSIKQKLSQMQHPLHSSGKSSDSLPASGTSGTAYRGASASGVSAFGWTPNSAGCGSQNTLASSPNSRSSDSLQGSDSGRSQRLIHIGNYPRTPSQEITPAILEEGQGSEYLPMQAGQLLSTENEEMEGGSGDTVVLPIPKQVVGDYTSMGGESQRTQPPVRSPSNTTSDSAYTEMSSPRTSVMSSSEDKESVDYTKMGPAPSFSSGSYGSRQHSRQASYNMEEVTVTHLRDAEDSDSCYSSCTGGSAPQSRAYSVGSRPGPLPIIGLENLKSTDSGVSDKERPPSAGSVGLGASAATYQTHHLSHLSSNLHPLINRLSDSLDPSESRKRAYSVGSKWFGAPFRKLSHGTKHPLAMTEEVNSRMRSGSFGSSSGRGTPHAQPDKTDGEDLIEIFFGPSPLIDRSPSGSLGSYESLTRSRTGSTGATLKQKDGRPFGKFQPSGLLKSSSSCFHRENCTIREVESPTQKLEKEVFSGKPEEDYLAMGARPEEVTPKASTVVPPKHHHGVDGVESREELEMRLAQLSVVTSPGKELPDYINYEASSPTDLPDYAPMEAKKVELKEEPGRVESKVSRSSELELTIPKETQKSVQLSPDPVSSSSSTRTSSPTKFGRKISSSQPRTTSPIPRSPKSPRSRAASIVKFFSPIIGKIHKPAAAAPPPPPTSQSASESSSNSASSVIPARVARKDSDSVPLHVADSSLTSGEKLEMDVVVSYLMEDSDSSPPPTPTPAPNPPKPVQTLLRVSCDSYDAKRKYSEPVKKNLSPSERLLQQEGHCSPSHMKIRSVSGSARLNPNPAGLDYATLDLPESNDRPDRSPSPNMMSGPNLVSASKRTSSDTEDSTVYAAIDPGKSESVRRSSRNS